jgi:catechol 2,3-dioxygenase-like lactoylglutathione lyase family enzyme
MIVRTLDHIAVTVSDLDRSLAFYRDQLGLRVVEQHRLEGEGIETMAAKPGTIMQVVRLQAPESPNVLIDLQQYLAPPGRQSDSKLGDVANAHFCFGVANLDQTCRDFAARGVEFYSKPVTFDLDFGKVHVVFLRDPDGFVLEFMEIERATLGGNDAQVRA